MWDATGLRPLPYRGLVLDCQFHLQAYPMRTLEEMCADTLTLEQEIEGLLSQIMGGGMQ